MLTLDDGSQVAGRAVILATGVSYQRLGIPELDRPVGAGVFYGAAGVMAPAVAGEEVHVIGGASSAGQAALHLARYAAQLVPGVLAIDGVESIDTRQSVLTR